MADSVTVRTPPTMRVSHGPESSIALPLVPRVTLVEAFALILLYGFYCALCGWILWNGLLKPVAGMIEGRLAFQAGFLLFAVPFLAVSTAMSSVALERLASCLRLLLSRQPVLEIHADGLIDRRALKRKVLWSEFHRLNARHTRSMFGWPFDLSFRLEDGGLRRFSPLSHCWSFFFGGKRAEINTYGFKEDPLVILEVIHTMIWNAQASRS